MKSGKSKKSDKYDLQSQTSSRKSKITSSLAKKGTQIFNSRP